MHEVARLSMPMSQESVLNDAEMRATLSDAAQAISTGLP